MPEPYTTNIALYFIFNAIDNDNNALACLFIKTAIILRLFLGRTNSD